ncbi:unnamed protein product [Pylaiella littoralis]
MCDIESVFHSFCMASLSTTANDDNNNKRHQHQDTTTPQPPTLLQQQRPVTDWVSHSISENILVPRVSWEAGATCSTWARVTALSPDTHCTGHDFRDERDYLHVRLLSCD